MSEKKKGLWSKVFGPKPSSGCCSVTIEEETEESEQKEAEAGDEAKDAGRAKRPEPAPCCGGAPVPTGRGRGGCCG